MLKFIRRLPKIVPTALPRYYHFTLPNYNRFEEEEFEQVLSTDDETTVGQGEKLEYKSETKRLLNIVTNSLYKNKEIFLRELLSNSSDAIERTRVESVSGDGHFEENEDDYVISIFCDSTKGTITVVDNGCGMSKEELETNLGTICYSGSEQLRAKLNESGDVDNIIGQFGVGFYSVFMVADEVTVFSKSRNGDDSEGWCWNARGDSGSFSLSEAENVEFGTKIILKLKPEQAHYAHSDFAGEIVNKYSNFLRNPVELNGKRLDSLQCIWLRSPKSNISQEEHDQLFEFLTKVPHSSPLHVIPIETDYPEINGLFYVPAGDKEGHLGGLVDGPQDSDVHIYSKGVLIQRKNSGIVPNWLRFMTGVVESDDLQVNVSRESVQEEGESVILGGNIQAIGKIVTKKILNALGKLMNDDFAKFERVFVEFEKFIKEGVTMDYTHKDTLAKLLIYETSLSQEKKSLKQYVDNMPSHQQEIIYVVSTNREMAESSPYFHLFKEKGIEVVFSYNPFDDFVFASLGQFNNYPIVPITQSRILQEVDSTSTSGGAGKDSAESLVNDEFVRFVAGVRKDLVKSVSLSPSLANDTPAVILNPENATLRLIQKMQDPTKDMKLDPQELALNPENEIVMSLADLYQAGDDESVALVSLVVEHLIDMALMEASLIDDPRVTVSRTNRILEVTAKLSKLLSEINKDNFKEVMNEI